MIIKTIRPPEVDTQFYEPIFQGWPGRQANATSPTASGLTYRRFLSADDKCLFNSFLKVGNKLLVA